MEDQALKQKVQDMIDELGARYLAESAACDICQTRKATGVGLFVPDPEHRHVVLTPKGKTRLIFFPLCDECIENPKYDELLDEMLKKRYGNAN